MMRCLFRLSFQLPYLPHLLFICSFWAKFRAQGALEVAHTAGLSTQNIHENFAQPDEGS